MLCETERHEALQAAVWDEERALGAIRAIVDDIERDRGADGHWRAHPLDAERDPPRTGFHGLYLGSAGMLWALWWLQRAGAVTLRLDPAADIGAVEAAYRAEPDAGEVVPSYFLGEVGILLVRWRLTGSAEVADRLFDAVRSNIANPTNEALWAAPGTMIAAWHLWRATGDERWRALFVANADHVFGQWHADAAAGCHLWTQDMYGRVVQYLGAGHGFAGNVHPLLKGAAALDPGRRETLYARCVETLLASATTEDGLVNWRVALTEPRPGRPAFLMQWCHGAPGFVTALVDFPRGRSAALEELLVGAGHAVWQAGPLTKGYGLCHGTAGNGEAFLVLHARTGEPLWLERARAFALHAVGQRERMRQATGQGRHTLWTGDAGLAVYLWQCIRAQPGMPGLDFVD